MVAGKFINLDQSVERRRRLEVQLQELSLGGCVTRFRAHTKNESKGVLPASVWSCFQSHRAVINGAEGNDHLLVMEDDVLLTSRMVNILAEVDKVFIETEVDLIFLGQTVPFYDIRLHSRLLRMAKSWALEGNKCYLLPGQAIYRYGSFAYVVNRSSLEKLQDLLNENYASMDPKPIDNLFRSLISAGRIKGVISFPYVVGIDSSLPTTLTDRKGEKAHEIHASLVNLYLWNHEMSVERSHWANILQGDPDERRLAFLRQMYEFLKG